MNIYSKLTIFLLVSTASQSQTIAEYTALQEKKNDSIIISYKNVQTKPILSLLPTVSYDALNQSFNVGISISNIATFFQRKQSNNIQIEQLDQNLKESLKSEIEQFYTKIEQLDIKILEQKLTIENFKTHLQIFEIQKGKKENGEISTEEYLKSQLAIQNIFNANIKNLVATKLFATQINQRIETPEQSAQLENLFFSYTQLSQNFGFLRQSLKVLNNTK